MSIYDVTPVSAEDYRVRARRRLPKFLLDYLEGGAGDEETLARNTADFSHWHLRQQVMRDVSTVDTRTRLLGDEAAMPLVLAPVGMAGMYARRGETQGARAAEGAGVPFTTSTVGICSVEEVAAASARPVWFQLYMLRDRDFVEAMLARALESGCRVLVFTVDLPVTGMRLRDYRNGMLGGGVPGKVSQLAQLATSPLWAFDVGIKGKPHTFGNLTGQVSNPDDLGEFKSFVDSQFDPTCTWEDIRWLRSLWPGKLLIKGVMEADDARAAVDAGADGVVVSNHGGRQMEGVASSISKLADVAAALGAQCEVMLDGGIRSGVDVVKAVALGASGVMIGRPWIWALAARGQRGVADLLDLFQREIATSMALMGVNRIEEISPELIEYHR